MSGLLNIPRLVIAGTGSGVGKTTVVLGLVQALQQRGLRVATFKCGPDYLDPTYHARVTGRVCHNLDGWLMGREAVLQTFAEGCQDADIAVIEGVMGLYDGLSPTADTGSTAEIAKWLKAPVLLVIDAKGMARTIAPIAQGLCAFDPELIVKGVVTNFVGSPGHLALLRAALAPLPVVGGFPKSYAEAFPERHLGLHSATEVSVSEAQLKFWGDLCVEWFDLDQILKCAVSTELSLPNSQPTLALGPRCKIGVALDASLHFYYANNLTQLKMAGAELVYFSPIHDSQLPAVDGLYFGGGYPELFALELAQNESMKRAVREFAASGRPIYAECGGLMYLSENLVTTQKETYAMVGLIPATVTMGEKLKALGYVEVATERDTLLGPAGLRFRGHQFRYSDLTLNPLSEVDLSYRLRQRRGNVTSAEGYSCGNVLATYVHAHWASNPAVAEGFVAACLKVHS